MPDVKALTMRELNRKTSAVLDAVERGETFELRRHGRAIGYITQDPPQPSRRPDWKSHFNWLRKQSSENAFEIISQFEGDRQRQAAREREMGNLE